MVWDRLGAEGVARFPFPPHGRIPNFAGAEVAAARLLDIEPWRSATAIKVNPDSPQRPLRAEALRRGRTQENDNIERLERHRRLLLHRRDSQSPAPTSPTISREGRRRERGAGYMVLEAQTDLRPVSLGPARHFAKHRAGPLPPKGGDPERRRSGRRSPLIWCISSGRIIRVFVSRL